MNHIEFVEMHVKAELIKQGFTEAVAQGGGTPGQRHVPAHVTSKQKGENF